MAQIEFIIQEDLETQDMFTVNLNHSSRPDMLVCPGKIVIKKGRFSFSFPKGKYKLMISEEVIMADGLDNPFVLKPGESMFGLQCGDDINISHTIDVTGLNAINFNVLFRPGNILDCKWKENRELIRDGNHFRDTSLANGQLYNFTIKYTVTLLDDSGDVIRESSKDVEVAFDRFADVKPAFCFVPSPECVDGVAYDSTTEGEMRIGTLRVSNSSGYIAAPSIDTLFEVIGMIEDDEVPGLLSLGNPEESVNHWDRAGYMIPVNPGDIPNYCQRQSPGGFELRDLDTNKVNPGAVGNESYVSFPVMWNMSRIENPREDCVLTIVTRYRYKKSYENRFSDSQDNKNNMISFRHNQEEIKLEISFDDSIGSVIVDRNQIDSGSEAVCDVRYPKNDPISVDQEFNLDIKLANTASAGSEHSALVIKDFLFGSPVLGNLTIQLTDQMDIMRSLFSIHGALVDVGNCIILSKSEDVSMRLTYRPRYIREILKNGVTVYSGIILFPYSFKYAIDPDGVFSTGGHLDFINVKGVIEFKVAKIASREWLCVDFGSSAVVGAYGTGLRDDSGTIVDNLIPLKERKERCLLNCFPHLDDPVEQTKRKDNSESSTYLITSATTLDGTDVTGARSFKYSPNDFGKKAICFSPSSGMQKITHILPCMKSMMGHKLLPKNLIPDDLRRSGLSLVEVNHIFEVVYKQLFGCFFQNEAANSQKLVMSVPNTYSPVHLEILRNIAKECMPELRPDYTNFISESDAVACYYLSNQLAFCKNSGIDPEILKNSNVLVYDMGAGTLDLTYFTQRKADNRIKISIDGKMGVSKAGNYLDYVLASIIVDMIVGFLNDDTHYASLQLSDRKEAEDYKNELKRLLSLELTTDKYAEAFPLKNYVKNTIKPVLNNPEKSIPGGLKLIGRSVDSILSDFTIGDILSHIEFRQFLKEATEEVFRHFVSLFGESDNSQTARMKVDVIIFSGRMTGIKALRTAVKDALKVFMPSDEDVAKCMYADLASKRFVDITEEVEDVTDLKTVVVDGAMAYCTQFQRGEGQYQFANTNIYATYGLILEKQDGSVAWLPLIDSKTKPAKKGRLKSADGITINQYDTNISRASVKRDQTMNLFDLQGNIDGSMLSSLYLIQSYSSNPAYDWEQEQKEMMTILGKYDSQPIPLSYRLVINERNELQFSLAGYAKEFLPHDDIKNKALRKSNWPISFDI